MCVLSSCFWLYQQLRSPIIVAILSMVFGMSPIALASGNGAGVKNGMAWVIIGGLLSSLLLTLILVPTVYISVDLVKTKAGRLFAKKAVVRLWQAA
jgi:HAE1 family hydrophobic/amphiphilic exporter-1